MRNAGLIAWNTLLELLTRRIVHVAALLSLLSLADWYFSSAMLQRAHAAGEANLVAKIAASMVTQGLQRWAVAGQALAMFLAAGALAAERRSRTIITLLARPVERWQLLVGYLAASATAGLLFVLVGVLLAVGVAWWFALPTPLLLWLGAVFAMTEVLLATGIAVALSTVLGPIAAAIAALLLWTVVPSLAQYVAGGTFAGPIGVQVARVAYYLVPAQMPVNLFQHAYATTLVDPRWDLYVAVMAENLGYAAAAMLIASLVFRRRDIAVG